MFASNIGRLYGSILWRHACTVDFNWTLRSATVWQSECDLLTNPTVFASCGHSALHHQASHLKGVPGVTLQPIGSYLRGDPTHHLGWLCSTLNIHGPHLKLGNPSQRNELLGIVLSKRAENQINYIYIHSYILLYITIYIYSMHFETTNQLLHAFATSQLSLLWTKTQVPDLRDSSAPAEISCRYQVSDLRSVGQEVSKCGSLATYGWPSTLW